MCLCVWIGVFVLYFVCACVVLWWIDFLFSLFKKKNVFFFTLAQPKVATTEMPIRRTASLNALYVQPSWSRPITGGIRGAPPTSAAHHYTVLHMDKATQTDESYLEQLKSGGGVESITTTATTADPNGTIIVNNADIKIEKVLRQRLQRGASGGGGGGGRSTEHSVSSQTLSPIHHGNFGTFYLWWRFDCN